MEKILKILKILTYIFLVLIATSYFGKNRLVGLDQVTPETLKDPIQTVSPTKKPIIFEDNGYSYEATPLYKYKVSGIVVHKKGYSILSDGVDKTAPYDLCIVWGDNVKNEAYLENGIRFSQDQRWCMYSYSGISNFDRNQFSNNHLLIRDNENYKIEKSISLGDEVEITGHLVNIRAGEEGSKNKNFTWNSSTSREDSGDGACEVILVDSIKIKTRAHPIAVPAYQISLYLLPIIVFARIVVFFLFIRPKKIDTTVDFIQT